MNILYYKVKVKYKVFKNERFKNLLYKDQK